MLKDSTPLPSKRMLTQEQGPAEIIRKWKARQSVQTEKFFSYWMTYVLKDVTLEEFLSRAMKDRGWATSFLENWIIENKSNFRGATVRNYIQPFKSLTNFKPAKILDANNQWIACVDWETVNEQLPRKSRSNHKAPKMEVIRKLYDVCDEREKFMLSLHVSSAIRVGAWDYFTLKDYQIYTVPETKRRIGWITVYRDEPEQYTTFASSENVEDYERYIELRKRLGEQLTDDSPLLRQPFDADSGPTPRATRTYSVKQWFRYAWKKIGVAERDFKQVHGFRTFYKTTMRQLKDPYAVKMNMGHVIPKIDDSYYRSTEEERATQYDEFQHLLTISPLFELNKSLNEKDEQIQGLRKENEDTENRYYVKSKRLEEKQAKTDKLVTLLAETTRLGLERDKASPEEVERINLRILEIQKELSEIET